MLTTKPVSSNWIMTFLRSGALIEASEREGEPKDSLAPATSTHPPASAQLASSLRCACARHELPPNRYVADIIDLQAEMAGIALRRQLGAKFSEFGVSALS